LRKIPCKPGALPPLKLSGRLFGFISNCIPTGVVGVDIYKLIQRQEVMKEAK
jgi:hypothetical protein